MIDEQKIYFACKQMEMLGCKVDFKVARYFYYMGGAHAWKEANKARKEALEAHQELEEALKKAIEFAEERDRYFEQMEYYKRNYELVCAELKEANTRLNTIYNGNK